MTAAAWPVPPALAKEVRALLPTYGAALVAVVVGSFGHGDILTVGGLLAFGVGAIALGAQAFGHEYGFRTLSLLLALPTNRGRLFFTKIAVLAVMLVTLTAITLGLYRDLLRNAGSSQAEPAMFVLAAACALFVAPCLTMLCRSTLAAVVFTIAIPGVLATGGDLAGGLIYGLENSAAVDQFALHVFWRGMLLICVASALAGWRMFSRLEVIDGHGPHVHLPFVWSDGARVDSRRRHPVWALVVKELHLQQMAFVAASSYVCLWLALLWLEHSRPSSSSLLIPLTVFYGIAVSLLAGAMSSAEERQMGTLDWQTLVPLAAWKQWLVKIGAAFALALLLGIGLPLLLHGVGLARDDMPPHIWRSLIVAVVLLTAGGIWVSTLCTSGVAALVAAFPAAFATVLFGRTVLDAAPPIVAGLRIPRPAFVHASSGTAIVTLSVIAAGLILILLWLAFGNHRRSERRAARALPQALAIAGYITAGLLVLGSLGVR